MKAGIKILLHILVTGIIVFLTLGICLTVVDNMALQSVLDDDYIDVYELVIGHDYNCMVVAVDEDYKHGQAVFICVHKEHYYDALQDNSYYFKVKLEVKKVAPFRYEWVEVELWKQY